MKVKESRFVMNRKAQDVCYYGNEGIFIWNEMVNAPQGTSGVRWMEGNETMKSLVQSESNA